MSFLSTTSYPYAKILARELRAAAPDVKLAFGGVFATLNAEHVKRQVPEVDFVCRGDGEQLILDLVERLDDPAGVMGVTWQDATGAVRENPPRMLDRNLDQWPFPDRESLPLDFVESMPLDVPVVLSRERFTTMQTSRGCPWPCIFCDIPIFNEGKWRSRSPEHVLAEFEQLKKDGYGAVYFVDDHFLLQPKRIEAICKGINDARPRDPVGLRGARRLGVHGALPGHGEGALPHAHVRHRERQPEDPRPPEEGADARADRDRGQRREEGGHRDRARLLRRRQSRTRTKRTCSTPSTSPRSCRSTRSPSTASASTAARRSGRSTSSAASSATRTTGTSTSSARRSIRRCSRARRSTRSVAKALKHLIIYKFTHFPRQAFRLTWRLARNMPWHDVFMFFFKPLFGKKSGQTHGGGPVTRSRARADHERRGGPDAGPRGLRHAPPQRLSYFVRAAVQLDTSAMRGSATSGAALASSRFPSGVMA